MSGYVTVAGPLTDHVLCAGTEREQPALCRRRHWLLLWRRLSAQRLLRLRQTSRYCQRGGIAQPAAMAVTRRVCRDGTELVRT